MRWSAGAISWCQPEMWATMSRALHVPSHTSRICASPSPARARLKATNSVSAPLSSVVFSDMAASGSGPAGRDALVEEQLPDALRQVVDVAARGEAERGVHADRRDVGLLGGGEQARGLRAHLDRLEELPGDALAPEVLTHHDKAHEGALEPVQPVGDEAHHLAFRLGDDQVVPLHVRADEGGGALLADDLGRERGATHRIRHPRESNLDHG